MNHTGQELQLMLENQKPLAMFYDDAEPEDGQSLVPEDEFDRYVQDGVFSKAAKIYEGSFDPRKGKAVKIKYVLYSLKGEEWRMPAMFMVLDVSHSMAKYDEGIDRISGALLGYKQHEIDDYVAKRK